MTGYQEVLTDPSYCEQIVTMTAPQIGNVGVTQEDLESGKPYVAGFIMRENSPLESNWRSEQSLAGYLADNNIVALDRIDTRTLTRHIRDKGAQMGAMGTEDRATLHDMAKAAPPMEGRNLTGKVGVSGTLEWEEGRGVWQPKGHEANDTANGMHIVAVDFGIKRNILRCLVDTGARVSLVPAETSASQIQALNPSGVFLSNGPGDPAAVETGIGTVRELLGKVPVFGICLGHQLLSLALGGSSYKLKFGHRGLNQPVKDLATGRVEVTSQNHGFAIDVESLKGKCDLTHLHLNDGTCEGVAAADAKAFSVQYHPESSAGPHDSLYLFDRFVTAMQA